MVAPQLGMRITSSGESDGGAGGEGIFAEVVGDGGGAGVAAAGRGAGGAFLAGAREGSVVRMHLTMAETEVPRSAAQMRARR